MGERRVVTCSKETLARIRIGVGCVRCMCANHSNTCTSQWFHHCRSDALHDTTSGVSQNYRLVATSAVKRAKIILKIDDFCLFDHEQLFNYLSFFDKVMIILLVSYFNNLDLWNEVPVHHSSQLHFSSRFSCPLPCIIMAARGE